MSVIKTINPDRSEQRVIFGIPTQELDKLNSFVPTPWENYAYDANDLAPLTHPNSNVPQSNWYTPKSSLTDALGRTIKTTEHKAHYNATAEHYEDVVMSYRYDIRGNLLTVKDPYNRTVFEHKYDLRPPQKDDNGEQQPLPPLWTRHIDSGESVVLFDATGKAIESKDAKGARSLSAYDVLQRPIYGWSKNNNTDTLRLTAHAVYGEQATTPKADNLNGQLWKQYDESGKIESVAFDFKGNLLSKKQQVISSTVLKTALDNYETYLVDWTGLPNILDTTIFETSSEFDALGRATKITLPKDVENERKEIIPTYNRAGGLEKVHYNDSEYVENITYNAKGQRLLVAFGNDIMTRYAYDSRTFRLLRQRSEKYVKTQVGNQITYTPQSGTNKQDDGFNFDLVGNILKILHRVNDCGINGSLLGSNALDRNFDYDPLYRVVSADGRESDTQNQNDYLYSDAPAPGTPNANNVRSYQRKYAFDKLGNIQQLKQLGTNGFTRNFSYNAGHNTLQKVETPTPTLIEDFTYDNCGNQLTAGTTRNYVWNAGNQLVTYYNKTDSADPTIFAQYDYSGMNRVSKLVKTGTTYERTIYINEIFEYCILENGTTYEKNEIHIMDDKSRIAMVRVGTPFPDDIADAVTYNLEDQIGSSSVRLNTYGTVIDREEYYPYGDSSLRTFTKKRYRYVGKEKDLESGLYYYGARYYLAWTCRFISIDPLAHDYMHLTPYNYAGNKPINSIDIDGMQGENESTTAPITNGKPENSRTLNSETLSSIEMTPNGGKIQVPMEASNLTYFGEQGASLTVTSGDNSFRGKLNIAPNSLSGFDYLGETYYASFDPSGYFTGYQSTTNSDNFIKYGYGNKALPINTTSTPRSQGDGSGFVEAGAALLTKTPATAVAVGLLLSLYYASNYQNISVLFEMTAPINPIGGFVQEASEDNEGTGSGGKNGRHGDSGRAEGKAEKQIQELEEKIRDATGKTLKQLKQKLKNVKENAKRAKKGEEHSRANKR